MGCRVQGVPATDASGSDNTSPLAALAEMRMSGVSRVTPSSGSPSNTENTTASRSSMKEVTVAVKTSCPRTQAAESWPAETPDTARAPDAPVKAVSRREMRSPGT